MKIKPEHIAHMQSAIATIADRIPAHREAVKASGKFQDLEKRIRWDAARAAGLIVWICDNLYPYANDTHVDTALRHIMRELKLSEIPLHLANR